MKARTLTKVLIVSATCAVHSQAQLQTVAPVQLSFTVVETVFARPEASARAIEQTKYSFMLREYVLDATNQLKTGKIWCKRESGESYMHVFREMPFPITKLRALKSASITELQGLLGEPVLRVGPMDGGTVLWEWRLCHPEQGDRFAAIEVAAGFSPKARTNVFFLLLSEAEGRRGSHKP